MRLLVALGLVAVVGSCAVGRAEAASSRPLLPPTTPAATATSDFNGDGAADLAIGSPGPRFAIPAPTGELNVIYGSGSGLSATAVVADQFWTQDSPDINGTAEPGDHFGQASAAGDFNNDGRADLAIGAPGDSVGSADAAGVVNVIYGSSGGLSATAVLADQLWSQDTASVNGTAEAFDSFGSALTTGDFNGDGYADLAVGVSGEGVNGESGAGGVNVLYGSAAGLSATTVTDQLWNQDSTSVNGTAAAGDGFGGSLVTGDFNDDGRSDLAIGAPNDTANGQANAGVVNVLYGSPSGLSATATPDQQWSQASSSVDGIAQAGDLFGVAVAAGDFNHDGTSDLAVGVPEDDVSGAQAGAVNVIYGSPSGLSATTVPDQLWTQDVPGVSGTAATGDAFGWAVAAGDFDGGSDDLAVGARGDSFGGTAASGSGAVNILYGTTAGLSTTGSSYWAQGQGGLLDTAETDDEFGVTLMAADFNADGRADLAASAAFEAVGTLVDAGAVSVLYARSTGIAANKNQFWTQDSTDVDGTATAGDEFGVGLG